MMSEEEYEESLQKLRDFHLEPVTERLRERHGVENAGELENKFRRFIKAELQMRKESKDESLSPSPELDEYWHQFILDTPRYHEFCDEILGGYLHHVPTLSDDHEDEENYAESMQLWNTD
ncbi:hypothetical protein BRC81_06740 [Halobacteriales archaeon QS_1_68_20]|nr:MAG: hypothetical protein BRC81_06740 [Halobacteriales archaeon QS_1_68_20]